MLSNSRILAIGTQGILDTNTGELHEHNSLATIIHNPLGGIVTGSNLFDHVGPLQKRFAKTPGWVCRIAGRRRVYLHRDKPTVIGTFVPVRFGFRDPSRHRAPIYYDCLDLQELTGSAVTDIYEVLETCREILAMMDRRGINFSSFRGGVAARLLKASPHWERGRKPAPRFMNDIAREKLPGNHYETKDEPGEFYNHAIYLDQVSAHHNIARTLPLPHPEHLRARGRARYAESGEFPKWLLPSEPGYQRIRESHIGLVCLRVQFGHIPKSQVPYLPSWIPKKSGTYPVWIYTNEWKFLESLPFAKVLWLTAAWTTPQRDLAIPEYADWALSELRDHPLPKVKKPTLLAVYGALATKSKFSTSYYAHGKGFPTMIPLAGEMKEIHRLPGLRQPRIVNVIARGMIEAECRLRSIELARSLATSHNVVAIYADGIMIEGDVAPIPPAGWRVEAHLSALRFVHPGAFLSAELSRLPGVTSAERRRIIDARAPFDRAVEQMSTTSVIPDRVHPSPPT